jgi:hypothetical protein
MEPFIVGLAGDGLSDAGPDGRAALPCSGWEERLDVVVAHGLAGLLARAWREERVDLDDDGLVRLEEQLEREATTAVRLEAELLRLAPLLDRHGTVVLKGAVLAHGAYASPELRPFTDLDVLVPTSSLPAVLDDLAGAGYRRPRPDPSRAFLQRVAKATVVVHPAGPAVDVHRTLVAGVLGEGIDVAELLAARTTVLAGNVRVPAPSWEAHLVEVALHAVVGDGLQRALSLRDVAEVATRPGLDADEALALAHRWRVEAPLRTALGVAADRLGATLPDALAGWASIDAAPRPAPVPAGAASARRRLDEVRHGHLRRRATVLRAMVGPDLAFLRWRFGDAHAPTLYLRRWRELCRRTVEARR